MTRQEILERERRWQLPAAIGAMAGVALVLAWQFMVADALSPDLSSAERLVRFGDESGKLLLAAALRASGWMLLVVPLVYLFRAAQARSPSPRAGMVGLMIAGPLFLAAGSMLSWVGTNEVADSFVAGEPTTGEAGDDRAEQMTRDSGLLNISSGLTLAGVIGMGIGTLYAALWAMRTGLLSRFWGSLGMAVGAVFLLLPFGLWLWYVFLGLQIAGWWPGGRLPAWEAGEARPWPKPGEEAGRGEEPPEVEYPGEFPDDPAQPPAGPPGSGDGSGDGAGEPGQAPRKRKRRR